MRFSSAVIVSVVFFCIFKASASVIPKVNPEEFDIHITERGTKFVEKITVDEENYLEYFHVPAHNELTEADYLYDFKNNMSVQRVKSKANCFLGPLPESLPKPADLKTGLQMAAEAPASTNKVTVRKYWAVTEQVDKTLLRQEVQEFCGQFPIYRLEEVALNSKNELGNRGVGRSRLARNGIDLTKVPFCDTRNLSDVIGQCKSHDWLYNLKIRDSHCAYWVLSRCNINFPTKNACNDFEHRFNSMICYNISCPPVN